MPNKISPSDLQQHFDEQMNFLSRSCDSYDSGYVDEAKRLSNTLRVLLHDTVRIKSLLGQMGLKEKTFVDTASELSGKPNSMEFGLVSMAMNGRFRPHLDGIEELSRQSQFDSWWNATILQAEDGRTFTRSELIRTMVEQDGGTHIDPSLDGKYYDLTRGDFFQIYWESDEEDRDRTKMIPVPGAAEASVRQIAHEVLKSFIPDYARQPLDLQTGFVGMGITVEGPQDPDNPVTMSVRIPRKPPSVSVVSRVGKKKIGRNEKCPCGSGKKYKHCHGRDD